PRRRIGRRPHTDFYTASTLQPVFGRLMVAAAVSLLGDQAASDFTFVEIGAEPQNSVLDGIDHPFAASIVLRREDAARFPPRAVVLSNELFDAQPFHRLTWRNGGWRELGIRWSSQGPE